MVHLPGVLPAAYRPANDTEAADVARVRELLSAADPWSRDLPVHLTASALVVHPPTRRVLLRWHERMNAWLQIGGHGDPGETDPLAVVLREGEEETGLADLAPWPGSDPKSADLLHVVVVPVPASPKEPAHEHADLRFVLATDRPDDARPERPTAPLRWVDLASAREMVSEDNLRETLSRVDRLF